MARLLSSAATLLVALALAAPAHAAERVALVIGNGAYMATTRLANPPNDAADMAAALSGLGFEVVAVVDGDLATMTAAIRRFGKLSAGADVALFYYAGHGIQVGETNYMLPVGAALVEEQDLVFEAIEVGLPLHLMDRPGARVKLVVLDACRNNPLAQTLASSLEAGGRGAAVGRGLARIVGAEGTLMAFATAPGAIADDGEARNSPFTRALLDNIATPGLEVSLLFRRVRADVMAATGDRQVPWVNEALLGEFYFAPAEEIAAPEAPTPTPPVSPGVDERAFELAAWETIKDSDNPAVFTAFLERYPDGEFAWLARIRIEEVNAAAEEKAAAETEVAALPPTLDPAAEERALGLGLEELVLIQRALNAAGHQAGAEDGIFGLGTRGAVQRWQVASNAEGTGYLTPDQAQALIEAGREVEVAVGVYPSAPRPGETFRDCAQCPEMVVVPAGSFTMGSPASEEGRHGSEGPQHRVTIPAPLAVGKYEVTFAEWDACVAAGGCGGYRPGDEGWGRGRRPVIEVNWDDAQAYVRWLSRRTGQRYRLLSESEWEYAVRAGTTPARYWGESPNGACGYANVHDATSGRVNDFDWAVHNCDDGVAKVASVGSYRANAFGLHDMLGNVWEWVEDCRHDDYIGAPSDGSASTIGGDCSRRVLRGGSWSSGMAFARSAFRYGNVTGRRGSGIGFRVARTL